MHVLNTYTTCTLNIVINHTDELPHLDSSRNLRLTSTSRRVGLNLLQTSQVVQDLAAWGYHLLSSNITTYLFSLGLSASQTSPWPPSQFNSTHESHRCQRMKVSCSPQTDHIKIILCPNHDCHNNPMRKSSLQNQITWVGSMMTTSANVQTPLINNTLSTWWCKDCTAGAKRHGFVFARHKIPHLFQWPQNHLTKYHARLSSPHHEQTKKMDLHRI